MLCALFEPIRAVLHISKTFRRSCRAARGAKRVSVHEQAAKRVSVHEQAAKRTVGVRFREELSPKLKNHFSVYKVRGKISSDFFAFFKKKLDNCAEKCVNGRKPAYWYRHGRNDKIQRDEFVNASLWILDFGYYYLIIIVRLATLSAASSPPDAYPLPGTGSRSTRFLSDDPTLHLFFSGIPGTRAGKHPIPACCGNPVKTVSQEMPEVLSEHIAYS